jgi:pimeloyl-ACP methyl ester carboxylesterase
MRDNRSAIAVRNVVIGRHRLEGTLSLPETPAGLVIFAHGSGSSRLSPRNTHVAREFNEHRLATLLFDLLTGEEVRDRGNVFDIALLGERVGEAIGWARSDESARQLPIGLFGASTGAAAALVAAARAPQDVGAVVSRGRRPDLAGCALASVKAPTLLIVGGEDHVVIGLNRRAMSELTCEKRLEIVAGATHLFDEPGTLEAVVELTARWFKSHLVDTKG